MSLILAAVIPEWWAKSLERRARHSSARDSTSSAERHGGCLLLAELQVAERPSDTEPAERLLSLLPEHVGWCPLEI
ncbi:hypothetical protein SRHO_G00231680 [Serrasalmus rhombeus]